MGIDIQAILAGTVSLVHDLVARQGLNTLSGTITGWTVNAGRGPLVSYPSHCPRYTFMRPKARSGVPPGSGYDGTVLQPHGSDRNPRTGVSLP